MCFLFLILHLSSVNGVDVIQRLEHPFFQAPPPRSSSCAVKETEHAEALFTPTLLNHSGQLGILLRVSVSPAASGFSKRRTVVQENTPTEYVRIMSIVLLYRMVLIRVQPTFPLSIFG